MEEFGYLIPTDENAPTRFDVYSKWTSIVNEHGGNGDLFWMLNGHQDNGSFVPDYDGKLNLFFFSIHFFLNEILFIQQNKKTNYEPNNELNNE